MLGSVHRLGREAPEYQVQREQALLDFLRRYVGGHYQSVVEYTRRLEAGGHWLEQQRDNWQRTAEQLDRLAREQADYIKQLEEVRASLDNSRREQEKVARERADYITELKQGQDYLENCHREQAAFIAQQEQVIREQADYIKQLLEAKAWLSGELERCQVELKRLRGSS